MTHVLEIIVLLFMMYVAVRCILRPLSDNMSGLFKYVILITGNSLILWGTVRIVPYFAQNIAVQWFCCFFLMFVGVLGCFAIFHTAHAARVEQGVRNVFQLSLPVERIINSVLVFCGFLFLLLLADLFIRLASLTPQGSRYLHHSAVAQLLRPLPPPPASAKHVPRNSSDISIIMGKMQQWGEQIIETSKHLRQGIIHNVRVTRDILVEISGTSVMMDYIVMVKELSELSDEENIYLLETTPALQQLATHSSLVAILEDQRLIDLIEQASHGSLSALYQLGDEPSIKHLFTDQEIAAILRQIDLRQLLHSVRVYRTSKQYSVFSIQ